MNEGSTADRECPGDTENLRPGGSFVRHWAEIGSSNNTQLGAGRMIAFPSSGLSDRLESADFSGS